MQVQAPAAGPPVSVPVPPPLPHQLRVLNWDPLPSAAELPSVGEAQILAPKTSSVACTSETIIQHFHSCKRNMYDLTKGSPETEH